MPLTIATSNNRCGPGIYVFITGLAGPVPLDDYLYVDISKDSHVNVACIGTKLCKGLTNVLVVPGVFEVDVGHNAATVGVAKGDVMSIACTQFHANGTEVASSTLNGPLWDPDTGLWYLQSAKGNADLQRVLDAVIRQFPPP